MTEFQVGDRVRIEGVVTDVWPDSKDGPMSLIKILGETYELSNELWFQDLAITLIERPRRKLRVGSVWERACTDGGEVCACGPTCTCKGCQHANVQTVESR